MSTKAHSHDATHILAEPRILTLVYEEKAQRGLDHEGALAATAVEVRVSVHQVERALAEVRSFSCEILGAVPRPDHQQAMEPAPSGRDAVGDPGSVVVLRDGTRALIRPIGPEDRGRLKAGFESASAESIFLRFLAPHPRLSSSELGYLTAVDHVRHEALIAVDPDTGQSFGTARYIRSDDDPATAEFAIGVGDRWMRIGLGAALLEALARRAREEGIARFTGLIHTENRAITRLVKKVIGPFTTRSAGAGALEMTVDLTPAHRQAKTGSSK